MDEHASLIHNARIAARKVARDASDSDDLAQETVMRVWRRDRARPEGVRVARARGLVRTILKRLSIDAWRRRRQERGMFVREGGVAASPLQVLAGDELRAAVRDLVARLAPVQRDAVRMRFGEGLTFREIAERQGVPLNTALGRVHDAIERIRQDLDARDETGEER